MIGQGPILPSFSPFWHLITRKTAILGLCLQNKLGPLLAKNPIASQGTFCYGQGPALPSFMPFWTLITRKTAILGFCLLNKLGPLVAKNPIASQGTLCYGHGPTPPSFIPFWPLIMPETAILAFGLLNKLAPWWPKRKNKTTFIIKIPPIYINKVALFSLFSPFKHQKQPFQGSGY